MMVSKLRKFYLFRWGLFLGSCHCPNTSCLPMFRVCMMNIRFSHGALILIVGSRHREIMERERDRERESERVSEEEH